MQARRLNAGMTAAARAWPSVLAAVTGMAMALGAAISPAGAQYTAPGTVTFEETTPTKDDFQDRIADAPWTAGAVRLSPWLGIRDASYVRNTDQLGLEEEDLTVTLGAGLRAYVKTGPKVVWSAHALPEYVWWQDLEDKRRFNGRYGLGFFGYFNRLTLEASQRRIEDQGYFSTEVQELTTNRLDFTRLASVLRVAPKVELFAHGHLRDFDNQEDETVTFSLLDREEEELTFGLRYITPQGLSVALAVEDRTIDFAQGARNLSSSGTAGSLAVSFSSPRLEYRLEVSSASLEPEPGSDFVDSDETLGQLVALWNPSPRLSLLGYARRQLRFAVDAGSSHFVGERFGARIELPLRAAAFGVYAEAGDDSFEPLSPDDLGRVDDVASAGASFRIQLRELVGLSARVVWTDYDSNFDQFDRDVTSFGFAIELGKILQRLSLGRAGDQW